MIFWLQKENTLCSAVIYQTQELWPALSAKSNLHDWSFTYFLFQMSSRVLGFIQSAGYFVCSSYTSVSVSFWCPSTSHEHVCRWVGYYLPYCHLCSLFVYIVLPMMFFGRVPAMPMLRLIIPATENISRTFIMGQQVQWCYKKKRGAHLHISMANISITI